MIIFGLKMESNTSRGTPLILHGALPAPWQGIEVILFWKLLNALQVIGTKWEKHIPYFSSDILIEKNTEKKIKDSK